MSLKQLPEILCPNCVQQGGVSLSVGFYCEPARMTITEVQTPVLACNLCDWFVLGVIKDGYAVFPDPHVQAEPQVTASGG